MDKSTLVWKHEAERLTKIIDEHHKDFAAIDAALVKADIDDPTVGEQGGAFQRALKEIRAIVRVTQHG